MITLAVLNALNQAAFTATVGPVFEHSSWIAEKTWEQRPFLSREQLHAALATTVHAATHEQQLALINAHPDLAGRLAAMGHLTPESTREQSSAGLGTLSDAQRDAFNRYNTLYRSRFGFPFIICARLNNVQTILDAFDSRLNHSREEEIATALDEVNKIAALRLIDLIPEPS